MSLALYRKYRPGSLAEVIGQDHVVEPLRRALSNDRVHHAYLFSGPRGCGKTSSARILARSLNCEQGPTPDPCGVCNSCVALAPNGSGSIDVIELDAATHGLVDDARDLREKAVYAPAASQYKIYIIDEAHQLGPGAANALLKLVEEPPPHLRFVFATTEPDKIIGTIRSRTHHYGFRLVPARTLQTHLASICEQEGLSADPVALALIARAAGGSVRDSLSILGQLLAGSGPAGLTYEEAAAQLGVTDSALIDDLIRAFAAYDGAALFRLVDRVVEAGHDPRRFVSDVLDRLRDLLIVSQVPDAAEEGLIDGPVELVAELQQQASMFGPGELSRFAEVVSRGLSDLKGATAPRLQLELLVARVILPGTESGPDSLAARVERLERGVTEGGTASAVSALTSRMGAAPVAETTRNEPTHAPRKPDGPPPKLSSLVHAEPTPAPEPAPAPEAAAPVAAPEPVRQQPVSPPEPPRPQASSSSSPPPRLSSLATAVAPPAAEEPKPAQEKPAAPLDDKPTGAGGLTVTIDQIRALWPAVLDEVKSRSRIAWMLVVDAEPLSIEGREVTASLENTGAVKRFSQGGAEETINGALTSVAGSPLTLNLIAGGPGKSAARTAPASGRPAPPVEQSQASADAEVEDSVDADDLAGIELVERELGAVKITEFDGG